MTKRLARNQIPGLPLRSPQLNLVQFRPQYTIQQSPPPLHDKSNCTSTTSRCRHRLERSDQRATSESHTQRLFLSYPATVPPRPRTEIELFAVYQSSSIISTASPCFETPSPTVRPDFCTLQELPFVRRRGIRPPQGEGLLIRSAFVHDPLFGRFALQTFMTKHTTQDERHVRVFMHPCRLRSSEWATWSDLKVPILSSCDAAQRKCGLR